MACSKVFSGDLPELISEIIQYFRNDFSTLHSCILVNRLWCRLSIPLLWEDPLSKESYKNYRFIEIYLHKLCEEEKVKLNEYGINSDLFPSNILFNYPSFIKRLNTAQLYSYIDMWAEDVVASTPSRSSNQIMKLSSFIFMLIIKIFIENEANIHTFDLYHSTYENVYNDEYFKSAFQLILQNSNFICNVKRLIIHLDSSSDLTPFIKCFYSNCNSILSLYIHYLLHDYVENDLFKVIDSQQNLKKIHITYNIYPLKSLKNSNCSNTLKTIVFYKIYLKEAVNFINEVFEQLNVLESIHIIYPLNSTFIQQIINLTKPLKLKSLLLDECSNLQIEQLKLLLQKSGIYLENFDFQSSINNELKLELFKLVKIYCSNIKSINLIGFDNQNVLSAFDIVKNIQQNLNYLNFTFCKFSCYYHRLDYYDNLSSIILQNLGQILPYKLEYLSLALKFNVNDMEIFLKNSQNIFIKKLLIRNKFYYQERSNILPCVKKYIMKENRITYLAIESIFFNSNGKRNELFDSKDEVEEFKFYGIQVKKHNDLRIQICDFINDSC